MVQLTIMITVILLLLLASLLWAITTFLDKHLISNVTKDQDYKGRFVFSTLVSSVIFIPVYLFLSEFKLSIDWTYLGLVFSLALMEVGYLIFYLKAMAKDDTSIITALFQFMPIISYFLGVIFLNETFTPIQIISGIIIIIATVALSVKWDENKKLNKDKLWALLFMFISSLMLAVQGLGFKVSAINTNFYATMFYFQVSLCILGIATLFLKPFRKAFLDLKRNNGGKVLFYNILNEVLNVSASSIKVYTLTLARLAFVTVFQNSTQIIIAFLMGFLLTLFKPKVFHEDISKGALIKKFICITVAIVATIFFVI